MCNSVLAPQQVKLVSKFDTKVKNGRDVVRPKKFRRLQEFKVKAKEGDQVSSNFLENSPTICREGLAKKRKQMVQRGEDC